MLFALFILLDLYLFPRSQAENDVHVRAEQVVHQPLVLHLGPRPVGHSLELELFGDFLASAEALPLVRHAVQDQDGCAGRFCCTDDFPMTHRAKWGVHAPVTEALRQRLRNAGRVCVHLASAVLRIGEEHLAIFASQPGSY